MPSPQNLVTLTRPEPILGMRLDQEVADEFVEAIPWVKMCGHQMNVPAVTPGDFGAAVWGAAGAPTTDSPTSPNASPEEFAPARAVSDLLLDSGTEEIYSCGTDTDLLEMEMDTKVHALQRLIGEAAVKGRGAGWNEPKGLVTLATAGQTTGANDDDPNGGNLLLGDVDRLVRRVRVDNARRVRLVMNRTVLRIWKTLFYQNGQVPEVERCPATGREAYVHGTARILVSDWIPTNETKGTGTNLSSMYAVVLGWKKGLVGIFKPGRSGAFVQMSETMLATSDQRVVRASANVGFALFAETALARLDGIQT